MLYTFSSFMIICCTAGLSFFAIGRIIMDVVFAAAMIAVAAINRSATNGCGNPTYPRVVYDGSGGSGCRLFVAAFAVAIISIFMFIVTAIVQGMIRRRGKTDAGPSRV